MALVALLSASPLAAQQPVGAVPCQGQIIRDVQIVTRPPYERDTDRWWSAPLEILNAMHSTTRPSVVRRFLLLGVGDPCVEVRRSESERLLRGQPFIASASVEAYPASEGGVVLFVITTDELTPVVDGSLSGEVPFVHGIKLGDGNVMGSGTYVAAEWGSNELRDTYGIRVVDYQALGRPWLMDAHAVRGDAGRSSWGIRLEHRFQTDIQRVAWRATARESHDVFDFYRGADDPVLLGVTRRFYDVGGLLRVGVPGRLSLFGVSLSRETNDTRMPPQPSDTISYEDLLQRFERRRSGRVNALWGLRNIYYTRAAGIETLTGTQDLPIGFQLGTLVGRGLSVFGTSDDDLLVAADVYSGIGSPRTFLSVRGRWEGRQNYDSSRWDGLVASGRMDGFWRASARHTVQLTLDWAAGWRTRIPMQLTLGERDGGVRGYAGSRDAGAMRTVVRLEDRWYLGPWRDQADVGLAVFGDAGRVRAGDAPYGTTTPVRVGVGIGLLAAVPPGSRRTLRLDVAYPLSRDPNTGWEIRLGLSTIARPRWREPNDVRFTRESSVPSDLFGGT